MDNMEENMLMLRDSQVQNLFDGYAYDYNVALDRKRITSYTTAYTQSQNPSRTDFRK